MYLWKINFNIQYCPWASCLKLSLLQESVVFYEKKISIYINLKWCELCLWFPKNIFRNKSMRIKWEIENLKWANIRDTYTLTWELTVLHGSVKDLIHLTSFDQKLVHLWMLKVSNGGSKVSTFVNVKVLIFSDRQNKNTKSSIAQKRRGENHYWVLAIKAHYVKSV